MPDLDKQIDTLDLDLDLDEVFTRVSTELDELKTSVSEVSRAATANADIVLESFSSLDEEVVDLDKTVRHAADAA